jgi:hypothetical protein
MRDIMKTGLVRDAQQTKHCVYNIPCDCDRCYIGKTSRHLEVHITEHKYNLTQGLSEKSKFAQHTYEEAHIICSNEARVLQIEPNTTYRKYKESTPVSDRPSDQSTLLGHLSLVDSRYHSRSKKNYNSILCGLSGEIYVVCVGTIWRICISSDGMYSDSSLMQGFIF